MAFITKASYTQFCKEYEIEIDDNRLLELFKEYILDDEEAFKIFNKVEIRSLLTQTVILLDEGERNKFVFKKKEYKGVDERKDNLDYIFKIGGRLCYHIDRNCKKLNGGFVNFNTPAELSEKKDDPEIQKIIQELRNCFVINGFTVERYKKKEFNVGQLVMRYNSFFPVKYKGICLPLNENYNLLEEKKTEVVGKTDVSKFNYENTLGKLRDILAEKYFMCNFDKSYLLSKYNYLYNKSNEEITQKMNELGMGEKLNHMGVDGVRRFLEGCYKLKSKAINILSEYIKYKYNFENKEFDPQFLEQYNFTACKSCCQ